MTTTTTWTLFFPSTILSKAMSFSHFHTALHFCLFTTAFKDHTTNSYRPLSGWSFQTVSSVNVSFVVPLKGMLLKIAYLCIWCTWSPDEPSIITESTSIHTHLYTIEFWVEEHKGIWSRDTIKIPVILNTNKRPPHDYKCESYADIRRNSHLQCLS